MAQVQVINLLLLGHAEEEREELRTALEATAIPHWFDDKILAALLGPELAEGKAPSLLRQLCRLPLVEPFPARGLDAWNVHKQMRLALRRRLHSQAHERFNNLSTRASYYLRNLGEADHLKPDARIELLYHELSVGSLEISELTSLCLSLSSEWSAGYQHQELLALGGMLSELIESAILPSSLHTVVLAQHRKILRFYEDLEALAKNAKIVLGVKPAAPVFVCYAHEDNDPGHSQLCWLDSVLQFLEPLKRDGMLSIFCDKDISVGDDWHLEIQQALAKARAAVLLISPAFMASQYVANNELPILLRKAKENGLRMYPILIRTCLFAETKFKYPDPKLGPEEFTLASLQYANPPSQPLIDMTIGGRDQVFLELGRNLLELVKA
jgi:hypothetical protein